MSVRTRLDRRRGERLICRGIIICCVFVGVICALACGYGNAALSRNLLISGEGSVVAEVSTFGIQYMQEMTPAICKTAKIGTSETLIDKRDGKSYWVAKMADEHCWMTQNLALNLTTAGLTSELSDLQPNTVANYAEEVREDGTTVLIWNADSKYYPRDTIVGPFTSNSTTANNVAAKSSRSEELFLVAKPTVVSAIASEKTSTLGETTGIELIDVTGWKPTFEYDSETGLAYDETSKTYDAHYLIGNYYANGAATAGSARSVAHTKAESSICPRGWMLPQQASNSTTATDGGWLKLLKAYGVGDTASYAGGNVAEPPLYLFRGGAVGSGTKYSSVGRQGHYWTMYGSSQNYRIGLNINNNAVSITELSSYAGRMVRCVARGEEKEQGY